MDWEPGPFHLYKGQLTRGRIIADASPWDLVGQVLRVCGFVCACQPSIRKRQSIILDRNFDPRAVALDSYRLLQIQGDLSFLPAGLCGQSSRPWLSTDDGPPSSICFLLPVPYTDLLFHVTPLIRNITWLEPSFPGQVQGHVSCLMSYFCLQSFSHWRWHAFSRIHDFSQHLF